MVTIRSARTEDEGYLISLMPRLADFPRPPWRTAGEIALADRPILRDALNGQTDGAAILVAETVPGGERVGYVFATTRADYFTRESHAHVEVLVVDPAAEGRGVARELMAAIEQWARDGALGFITLNVFDRNTRARELYHRLGYEPETVRYRKALGTEAGVHPSEAGPIVRVTRRLACSGDTVFDAWLDASRAGTWLFATPSGRMVEVAIDARVGGSFRLVECRDGEPVAHIGEYVAIERPSRLVFDFGVPKYSPKRNRVFIEFASCPAGCDVTLTQQLAPDMSEWADRVEEGWRGILDGLAAELARCAVAGTVPEE